MTVQSPTTPLTVVLIDDCDLATAGLRALLTPYGGRVRLLDPRAALARPGELDVILYEPIGLSPMGSSMLRDLQRHSEARTAVFSWVGVDELPTPVLAPHVPKRLSAAQIVCALEDLAAGRWAGTAPTTTHAPQAPTAPVPASRASQVSMTPRESDVIALVTAGRSNVEICEELAISVNSVKTYIRSAYRKMGVTRRSQAVLWGITHGFDQVVPGSSRSRSTATAAAVTRSGAAVSGTASIAMATLPS